MNEVRKFVVLLFGIAIGLLTTIAVMIKGWGLEPKSWKWIIGIYLLGHFVSLIMMAIAKDDK